MSRRPYHRRYHSDALVGTLPLTLEERGALITILDMLYDCGEPIVQNDRYLSGCMGCSLRKYRAVRDSLIEKGKIHITDCNRISNFRFEKEAENDAKFSRKQAENGSKPKDKLAENEKIVNENNGTEKPKGNPRAPSTSTSTSINKKETSVSQKNGTRLDDDWTLPPDWKQWAFEKGLDPPTIRNEADKFRNYWTALSGSKATKRNWQRTWQNWILQHIERKETRINGHGKRNQQGNGPEKRTFAEWFSSGTETQSHRENDDGFSGTTIDL